MKEPAALRNEKAVIMPYNRDKGGYGYKIFPVYGERLLTEVEMGVLLDVYVMLLENRIGERK